MVDSVNNAGTFQALEGLNRSNSSLNKTLSSVSTGKDVNSARDNAATFAIAQELTAETAGLSAVQDSLSRSQSQVDVSITAATQASDTLNELRNLAIQASDPGLDDASRASLNDAFQSTLSSFNETLEAAEFNGTNALVADGGSISAITSADASGQISVDNQDLTLGGANVALTDGASIATAADAANALSAIDQSLETVNATLSTLGSTANALEQSQQFTVTLSDTIEEGIGNLVDADLGEVAAQLAADQVATDLGVVALNIANQTSTSVLGLFEDTDS